MENKFAQSLYGWGRLGITMMKWLVLSVFIGGVIGTIASGFSFAVATATEFRVTHPLIIWGLPLGGIAIVYLYHSSGQKDNTGTNMVLKAIRSQDTIPGRISVLILASSVITHFFGGSAGREGAALQFGASLGDWFSRKLKLNESNKKIVMLSCMSAAFSALFGTPIAAALFPMEFVSVGIMYYSALVPCVMSSFVAQYVSLLFHIRKDTTPFFVSDVPKFYSLGMLKIILLAVCCAAVGVIFCELLHRVGDWSKKYIANPYVRVVVGGLAVILLSYVFGTDYLGLSEGLIHSSFEHAASPEIFILKMIFTCLTLCVGFKGGEIVPTLVVGASMGSAFSALVGLPADFSAACGMAGVFCAVTNSPISTMLIAFEMFGAPGMPFFCVVIAISYLLSGYQSLYHEQRIMYSKTENKYINQPTK